MRGVLIHWVESARDRTLHKLSKVKQMYVSNSSLHCSVVLTAAFDVGPDVVTLIPGVMIPAITTIVKVLVVICHFRLDLLSSR